MKRGGFLSDNEEKGKEKEEEEEGRLQLYYCIKGI